MVQAIDSLNKPIYNAVNIRITKPEVNAANSGNASVVNDNGVYNAVKIRIDNPSVNTEPKVYNYPKYNDIVTYDMLDIKPVEIPQYIPVAASYYESNVYIPQNQQKPAVSEPKVMPKQIAAQPVKESVEEIQVPPANYTTIKDEKLPFDESVKNDKKPEQAVNKSDKPVVNKKPEIIPSEPIKPEVDIALVKSNLESEDFDIQAQQIEEIARVSLDNPQKAVPYIVKDVFTDLIDITKKDTSGLKAPSDKQIEIRKEIITNAIASEIARQQNKTTAELPYNISKEDMELANEITPMEQAERNKEYAIYTLAVLSKVYIDEIQKETGNVVPFTDVPGLADIVNELRYNQNSGVKIAAIDSLRYLQRPEYKQEINSILNIATADKNPQVAAVAARSLQLINAEA